jgi:uncharacterized protein
MWLTWPHSVAGHRVTARWPLLKTSRAAHRIAMAARYHFRVSPPQERITLGILATDREGPLLAATFIGRRGSLTNSALLRAFFALSLVKLKIVAAIHWEALRLSLKGARLLQRPDAATANTILAAGKGNDYIGGALPAAVRRKPDPRGSALVH